MRLSGWADVFTKKRPGKETATNEKRPGMQTEFRPQECTVRLEAKKRGFKKLTQHLNLGILAVKLWEIKNQGFIKEMLSNKYCFKLILTTRKLG